MSHYWCEWGESGDGVSWLVQWDIRSVCCLKIGISWLYTNTYTHPCSLVVQLARDLQGDLYPYFGTLFPHLMALSNIHDPEVIQVMGRWISTCATNMSPPSHHTTSISPHITITFCIQWVSTTVSSFYGNTW